MGAQFKTSLFSIITGEVIIVYDFVKFVNAPCKARGSCCKDKT